MVSCFKNKSRKSAKQSSYKKGRTKERAHYESSATKLESCDTTQTHTKETLLRTNIQPQRSESVHSVLDEKYFYPSPVVISQEPDYRAVEEAQVACKSRLKGFRSSMIWRDGQAEAAQCSGQTSSGIQTNETTISAVRCPEFCINLDVSSYDPGEVTVKYHDGSLLVEGNHHADTEYGYETCSFYRKYPVPPGIAEKDISYKTRRDGVLVMHGKTIVAPTVCRKVDEKTEVKVEQNVRHHTSIRSQQAGPPVRKMMSQMRRQSLETIPDVEVEDSMEDFVVQGDKYVLDLNLRGFSPQDVYVNVLGRSLCVKCEQGYEKEDGVLDSKTKTKLEKCYILPKDIDITTISSKMSVEGQMKIEINKRKL